MIGVSAARRSLHRAWHLLIGLQIALLVFGLVAPAIAVAAAIQTDLWVYQNGDTVTVTGVEFGASEDVVVVSTDPSGQQVDRGTATTAADGGFTYTFVLNVTTPGIYDVVATGQTSGLSAATQFDPPPDAPGNARFSDSRFTTGGVTLTWDGVNQGADCYFVYRDTSAMAARAAVQASISCTAPPSRPNRIAVVQDPTISFTDTTATTGTEYFYFVTAIKANNANQGESASSNQVSTASLVTSPTS